MNVLILYENEIIQLYCNTDKKFLPDRYVIGTCPYCKANDQYSDLVNGVRVCFYSLGPDNSFVLKKTLDFEHE